MNIKQVSQQTGLSAHTLRYYEKIGLLLGIHRDSKGHRDYTDKDLIWIEFIKRLKATNMPLNEIKRFAELRTSGDRTIPERLMILKKHQSRVRKQMDELVIHQQKIKAKIELCKLGGDIEPK